MNTTRILTLGLALGGLLLTLSPASAGENVGTSQEDLPSYVAKFTLTNNSDLSIAYQVKWGNGAYKSFQLEPGQSWDHWAKVTNGRYPTPHIRFNYVAGTKKWKDYKMEGYEVGYSGYGPGPDPTTPKQYHFANTVNSDTVDLFSDN